MTSPEIAESSPSSPPPSTHIQANGLGSLPRWWRDPVLWWYCLASLLVYVPRGFHGYLSRDLSLYSYAGEQFAHGVAPYLGVINRAGPLAHAVPGIADLVTTPLGLSDVVGMRVFFMLLSIAAVMLSYLLGRNVFCSRLAGIGAAATLLCNMGFIDYATGGPREKTTMLLCFVIAMLAMHHRRWFTLGFFLALATLTWQVVLLPALAGAAVAVLIGERRGRIKALALIAIGGLVPLAITAALYAAIGHEYTFWNDFLLINARYTQQASLLNDPLGVLGFLWVGYGPSVLVFVGGLVAMVRLAIVRFRHDRDRDDRAYVMLMSGTAILVGAFVFAFKAINGFPDVFFLIPPAGLGVAGVLTRFEGREPCFVVRLVAGVCAVTLVLGLGYSLLSRDDELTTQQREVDAVFAQLPENATVLSVEAPQALTLSGKKNLTRYQEFGNGLVDYLDATWPGGKEGYTRDVLAKKPTVITLGALDEPNGWFMDHLDAYTNVGYSPGWHWYVRKSVGASTLQRIRGVLGG